MDEQEAKKLIEELEAALDKLGTEKTQLKSKLSSILDQNYAAFRDSLDTLEAIGDGDLETEVERNIAKRCIGCVVTQIKLNQMEVEGE